MINTFYTRILNRLRSHKADVENQLLQGNVEDFVSYKHLTGMLKGIDNSVEIVKDVFKNGEEDESDKY